MFLKNILACKLNIRQKSSCHIKEYIVHKHSVKLLHEIVCIFRYILKYFAHRIKLSFKPGVSNRLLKHPDKSLNCIIYYWYHTQI